MNRARIGTKQFSGYCFFCIRKRDDIKTPWRRAKTIFGRTDTIEQSYGLASDFLTGIKHVQIDTPTQTKWPLLRDRLIQPGESKRDAGITAWNAVPAEENNLTGDFNYSSSRGVCLRRDLRNMESLGLLKRGQMNATIRGVAGQEYQRTVATWHIPSSFDRDMKLLAAFPELLMLKNHEAAPTRVISTALMGDFDVPDSAWLIEPVIDWLNGETDHIELPGWFVAGGVGTMAA